MKGVIEISKYSNTVEYNLRTKVDTSGVIQLQKQFAALNVEIAKMSSQKLIDDKQVAQARNAIDKIQTALSSSFNSTLGVFDLSRFQKSLDGLSLGNIQQLLSRVPNGTKAFNNMLGTIGQIDTQFKSISSTTDKIFNTFGNTVRWGITASIFQSMQNDLYRAVEYVQELDTSLNNIRIVSGQSAQQMRDFSLYANQAAQNLGQTTTAFTDAALIFIQQGLDTETSNYLADLTLRMANVTQQDTATASEQITSIMNGYNMSLEETSRAIDSLANVAALGASDMEELATAESRVAATASTLGVSQEQLAAQISTIISVTRQAPETVGNALRSIYSRLADLQLGETLEDGVDLGRFSSVVESVGVQVLDATGNLRNMGDIIEDLMVRWQDLSSAQQISVGTTLAGRYQLNPFLTLMSNMEMYNQQLEVATDSAGTLDEQQSIYMDSMSAKLNQLTAASEGFISTLFNPDDWKPGIELATNFLKLLTDMADSIGGLTPLLTGLASLATKTFSNNLAAGWTNILQNRLKSRTVESNEFILQEMLSVGASESGTGNLEDNKTFSLLKDSVKARSAMTTDQKTQFDESLTKMVSLENQYQDAVIETNKIEAQHAEIIEKQNGLLAERKIYINKDGSVSQKSINDLQRRVGTQDAYASMVEKTINDMRRNLAGVRSTKTIENAFEDLFVSLPKDAIGGELNAAYESYLKASRYGMQDAKKETTQLIRELEKLAQSYRSVRDDAITSLSMIDERNRQIEESTARVTQAQQNQENARKLRDEMAKNLQDYFIDPLDIQARNAAILQMVGSVGELAFAWQTFQNLGSIWSNEDLDIAEKMSQTIQNMLFTVPMLISSFSSLSNNIGTFSKTVSVFRGALDIAKTNGLKGFKAIAEAARGATVAIEGSATATGMLKTGFIGLASSVTGMIAITAILAAISIGIGVAQQDFEDMKNSQKEAMETTASNLDTINTSVESFNELYKTYQETGEVSDALRESAQSLSDTLEIQGGSALVAAGHFDTLAASIKNAQDEAAQESLDSAIAAQNGYINRSIEGGWIQNGVLYDGSLASDFTAATIPVPEADLGTGYSELLRQASSASDTLTYIRTAQEMVEYLTESIDSIQDDINEATANGQSTSELEHQLDNYQDQLARIQAFLNDETVISLTSSLSQGANAEAQLKSQDYSDLMGADLVDAYLSDSTSQVAQFDALNGRVETLRLLIQNTTDELQRASLEAELATATLSEQGVEAGFSQEDVDSMIQDLQTRFDDEDIILLQASLDYEELVRNIDEIIERVNNGEDLSEILVDLSTSTDSSNNEFVKRTEDGLTIASNTRDSSDIDALINDLELEEDEYQDYVDAISSVGELSSSGKGVQQIEKLNNDLETNIDALEDQQSELEKNSEEYNNLQEQINDANQEIDDNNALLDDIRSRAIESAKGVQELSEVFEDSAEAIRTSSESSLEYTDAVNALVPGLEHLLNIDMSEWGQDVTNSFVAQNLNDIQGAIDGDVEALQRLRSAAAEQIMIQAGIDPNTDTEVWEHMSNIINWANANLPYIQAGAKIEDTFFYEQLQAMINSTIAAGGSISDVLSMLNGLGVEAQVTYKTIPVKFPRIKTNTGNMAADAVGGGLNSFFTTVEDAFSNVEVPIISLGDVRKVGTSSPSSYAGPSYSNRGGSGGGSGGGGGGGGSGSGKSYEPKTKDPVEDELDRYERVDTQLDALGNDFEKIADEQDRLLGDDLAKNMAKQIDLLKEQVYWQQEKLEIQKDEAAEYRNQLASQYGVTFNDEGFITNYADRYKAYLNNLNNLINQYNATTTEAGQEALDKQIEDAQEAFDEFNDLIDNYDDLISNQIKDSEAQIESLYDQIEDLQIEAFNRVVETVDNIKDIQETLVDFNAVFSGLNSDSPFREMATSLEKLKKYWDVGKESMEDYYDSLIAKNNEALKRTDLSEAQRNWLQYQNEVLQEGKATYGQGTLEAGGTGYIDMELSNLNTIIGQIAQFEQQGFASIFGENESALFETAKEIFDSATSMIEDYEGEVDNLRDAILDAIDEIGERIDDRLEQYQNINDELEHYGSLIEMLHGENAYDELNQALSAQVNNNQSQILVIKESIEILKDMQSAMEEGSEEWKAVQEQITDKQSELLDKTEETMEQLVEIYQNGVNKALDAWTADSPLGSDLDWVSDEWELINRNADYYLDDVNAAYNIQKLQGKYLELLDGTDDLLIQQQITNQMNQQLQYLREKNNLSQYDVDYANAQLEILQRTIALQEAQRNKSQLQLRRDTQGNYNYVYTANEGDIASAQGDLLDAQNNAYNLSKDQIKQTQDDSLSALQDAKNMLNDLWTDANLTLEEKTKRTQTIIDSLKEYLAGTGEQLSTAETNIINDFIGMCELLTDENRTNLEDVYNEILQGNNDAFDQIDTRWSTSLTQWLQNLTDFNEKTDEAFDNLVSNYESYQESLDELSEAAGTNFDDLTSHINNANDATAALNQTSQDFMTTIRDDAGVIKSYENQLAEMTAKIQDADNAMKAYQEQVNDLAGKLTAKEQENANLSNRVQELEQTVKNYEQYGNANGAGGGGGSGSGGVKGDSATAWGIAQAIWTYGSRSGWGNDPIRSSKLTNAFGSAFAKQVQQIINQNTRNGKLVNYDSMKYSSYNLIGYDTGGYTGNFSDPSGAGRLAILHSKELVLNESDTKNILQAVEAVRNLTTNFRNGAFENAVEALSNYGSEMLMSSIEPQDIEQNVHIEANFPNVIGAEEVERALLNLTNTAMQYANRNGRNPVNSNGSFS